ncbi:MAG: hypothetical protein MRZ79_06420 [Bacteroidia bacterium]|nr:hypothetical protein [Bacteroidia bacterium]
MKYLSSLLLFTSIHFAYCQDFDHKAVLMAALKTPGLKIHMPRNASNQICLETIYTNGQIPGNQYLEFERKEIGLLSDAQPEELSICQAILKKFRMSKKKAKVQLIIGTEIELKMVIQKVGENWYTKWLYTKKFIPVEGEVEVERTVERYSF